MGDGFIEVSGSHGLLLIFGRSLYINRSRMSQGTIKVSLLLIGFHGFLEPPGEDDPVGSSGLKTGNRGGKRVIHDRCSSHIRAHNLLALWTW